MRNLRCRVGDLAIVTRCPVPERIGLLVRVVSASPTASHAWCVEFIGPPVTGVTVQGGDVSKCRRAAAHDWNLTPIRGESATTHIASQEHAHA